MKNELTIVARIVAKKDSLDLVKSELLKLIGPTRSEQGCLRYDLHQDNENPEIFIFFESWENRKSWQIHRKTDHLNEYRKATEGAIRDVTVNQMTQID